MGEIITVYKVDYQGPDRRKVDPVPITCKHPADRVQNYTDYCLACGRSTWDIDYADPKYDRRQKKTK